MINTEAYYIEFSVYCETYFTFTYVFEVTPPYAVFANASLVICLLPQKIPNLLKPWLLWTITEMLVTLHTFAVIERSMSIIFKIYSCVIVYSYLVKVSNNNFFNQKYGLVVIRSHIVSLWDIITWCPCFFEQHPYLIYHSIRFWP